MEAMQVRKSLTVESSTIASWKYNTRVLGIAVSAIGRYGIGKGPSCEDEPAVVVVLCFSAGRHIDSSRACAAPRAAEKLPFITGIISRLENGSQGVLSLRLIRMQRRPRLS